MKNCLLLLFSFSVFFFGSCSNEPQTESINLHVDTIQHADTIDPHPTTKPAVEIKKHFKCSGNEPFWTLTINNTTVSFYEDAIEKRFNFPIQTFSTATTKYLYHSESEKNKILIEILKEHCEDDMSGESFDYSVTINKNGDKFSGCCKCLNDTLNN